MRFILLGSLRWMKAGAPMECGALKEVLPVKKTRREGQHGQV